MCVCVCCVVVLCGQQMLRATPKSLNALSYEAVIEMLEAIRDISPAPPSVQHVYVDTVGDPGYYKSKLLEVRVYGMCV